MANSVPTNTIPVLIKLVEMEILPIIHMTKVIAETNTANLLASLIMALPHYRISVLLDAIK